MASLRTASLPSLLYPGLGGGPGSLNLTAIFGLKFRHITNVLKEAVGRVPDRTQLVAQPIKEAEDAWINEVDSRAAWYSVFLARTRDYFNHEGDALLCHRGTSTGLLSCRYHLQGTSKM